MKWIKWKFNEIFRPKMHLFANAKTPSAWLKTNQQLPMTKLFGEYLRFILHKRNRIQYTFIKRTLTHDSKKKKKKPYTQIDSNTIVNAYMHKTQSEFDQWNTQLFIQCSTTRTRANFYERKIDIFLFARTFMQNANKLYTHHRRRREEGKK